MPHPNVSGGNDPVRQAALQQLRSSTSTNVPTQEQLPQQNAPGAGPAPPGSQPQQGGGQLAQLLLQIIQQAQDPQADLGPPLAQAFQMFVSGAADQNDIETLRAFLREYSAVRQQIGQTQRSQIDSFLMTVQKLAEGGGQGGQPAGAQQGHAVEPGVSAGPIPPQVAQAAPQPPR